MIIDSHAHVNAPPSLYAFQAALMSSRGAHGFGDPAVTDGDLREAAERALKIMDSVGTDAQLISPRPFSMMHSARPAKVVHAWISTVNDVIARQVTMFPDRLAGVAGLPQAFGETPADWTGELERAIHDLGFVGCVLNPDPSEGQGIIPRLSDPWWFPLFEKLCELNVPALIHSAGCASERETYSEHFITEGSIAILSLLNSDVFERFPDLKIIVSHGGGSVPYQIGRWRAARLHPNLKRGQHLQESFDESVRRLWFDTVLHHPLALELLIRTVGFDRCLFGTEKPGSGSAADPETGRDLDDLKPVIESMSFLGDDERTAIFSGNARQLHRLKF